MWLTFAQNELERVAVAGIEHFTGGRELALIVH